MSTVFISYRQTNANQRTRVRRFGERLRNCGIDVVLDQFFLDDNPGGPNDGWDKWSSDRALLTKYVLIVGTQEWFQCFEKTQPPGSGLGAACEADDLRHRIYESGGVIEGVRIVLFDEDEVAHIPGKLKRYHRFHAERDFSNIVRWLGGPVVRGTCSGSQEQERTSGEFISHACTEQHTQEPILPRCHDLIGYGALNIAKYESLVAGRSLVSLSATCASGLVVEAQAAVESWLAARDGPSDLLLVGDPGCGKTYLLRWLCARISETGEFVPIFIPAGQLQHLSPGTSQELLAVADPPAPPEFFDLVNLVVVLDGLDELIGPSIANQANYVETLTSIGRLIPRRARLVYSCRSTTFEATSKAVTQALRPKNPGRKGNDPTDDAIRAALGNHGGKGPEKLEINELSEENARQYLKSNGVGNTDNPSIEYVLTNLPRVPMILRFLQLALPELRRSDGRTDLDELYTAAIRTWILRDPAFANRELDEVWDNIKRRVSASNRNWTSDDLDQFVHAGLATRTLSGGHMWSHSSIAEFFVSLSLFDDLTRFDSSHLAQLDLIGSYNINRFLVPRCRRAFKATKDCTTVRPVKYREYQQFLWATGWRRLTGYGLHPSYIAEDGTGFTSGTDALVLEKTANASLQTDTGLMSAVSWYDAFAFCLWSGQRLPNANEIMAGLPLLQNSWVWCADWSDEPKAHVAVVSGDANGKTLRGGVNPDFRHSRIALATVDCRR